MVLPVLQMDPTSNVFLKPPYTVKAINSNVLIFASHGSNCFELLGVQGKIKTSLRWFVKLQPWLLFRAAQYFQ